LDYDAERPAGEGYFVSVLEISYSLPVLLLVIAPQEAPAGKTLEFGADRGYVYLDERGYIERIHSLFTIVGRYIFSSGNAPLSKTLLWMLESDDDSMPDPFGFLIANLFLAVIATRPLHDEIRDIGVQANFRKFEETAKPANYNIPTCLRLCSLRSLPVCEPMWPDALDLYGSAAIWFLSVDEMRLLSNVMSNSSERSFAAARIRLR
jgi:hypothetical protein